MKFSIITLFTISSLLFIQPTQSTFPIPGLIENVCRLTPHYHLCVLTLKSHRVARKITSNADVAAFAKVTLGVIAAKTPVILATLHKVHEQCKQPEFKIALEECISSYTKISIDILPKALGCVDKGDLDGIKQHALNTANLVASCQKKCLVFTASSLSAFANDGSAKTGSSAAGSVNTGSSAGGSMNSGSSAGGSMNTGSSAGGSINTGSSAGGSSKPGSSPAGSINTGFGSSSSGSINTGFGSGSAGSSKTGSSPAGSTGSSPAGSINTGFGSSSSGSINTGSGSGSTGSSKTGSAPAGSINTGFGSSSSGSINTGSGSASAGSSKTGSAPAGSTGSASAGSINTGSSSAGSINTGSSSAGPTGSASAGSINTGSSSAGSTGSASAVNPALKAAAKAVGDSNVYVQNMCAITVSIVTKVSASVPKQTTLN